MNYQEKVRKEVMYWRIKFGFFTFIMGLLTVNEYFHRNWLLTAGGSILVLGVLWSIFSRKGKARYIKRIEQQEYDKLSYEEKAKDLGYFTYDENGFLLKYENDEWNIKWAEIETIIAYKKDNYVIDTIWLDIYSLHKPLSIPEGLRGWRYFIGKLMEAIPEVDRSWEVKVMFPAFAKSYTLLYDKQGRTLEDVARSWQKGDK